MGIGTVGLVAQVALITHMLGISAYGQFAVVVAFVSVVNRLFDVQIGQAGMVFGSRYMKSDQRRAAGVFQFCYLLDVITGVIGFGIVVALAPFVGDRLVGQHGTRFIYLYALTLLISTVDQMWLLRLYDRFATISWIALIRETTRIVFLIGAIALFHSLTAVFVALVLVDAVVSVASLVAVVRVFRASSTGIRLFSPALATTRGLRRSMMAMILHTNLYGYGIMIQNQAPALVLGALRGPVEAGLFKIGWTGAQVIARVAQPVVFAALPRFVRLWADGRRGEIRRLIREVSFISVATMLAAAALLITLRDPIISAFAGKEAEAAGTVFAIAVGAQAVNGALFWNAPLLFAAGRARTATAIFVPLMVALVPTLVAVVRPWGAEGAAAALFVTLVIANACFTAAALKLIFREESGGSIVAKHT
jgi:O-antigen/teichoic acid export membrane protein